MSHGTSVIALSAGGTGGHIMPALAVAAALHRLAPVEVHLVGTRGSMEERLAQQHALPFHGLRLYPFAGMSSLRRARALFALPPALLAAALLLRRLEVKAAMVFGGYASLAVGLAAPRLGIPLLAQEQNSVPGRTTRLLARRAELVCCGFAEAARRLERARTEVTGNPVRPAIEAIARSPKTPGPTLNVLVLGGSQGAHFLNETAPEALSLLAAKGIALTVQHQTGSADLLPVRATYARLGLAAEVTPFIEDMASAYRRADLAVARSGALSVAELIASATPALLVPFPHATDDHQFHNAQAMVALGAAEVHRQDTLDAATMSQALLRLAGDRAALSEARARLVAASRPGSAERIAARLLSCAAIATKVPL